jgi:hypothetical protein
LRDSRGFAPRSSVASSTILAEADRGLPSTVVVAVPRDPALWENPSMTHYPQPGSGDDHPQSYGGDPFAQQGFPSGGYPSGELARYGDAPQTGGWQAASGAMMPSGQPLTSIGDITITQTEVITPAGRFPIKGSIWTVNDMTQTSESTPAYAIILAVLGFLFCLIGLLFLLIKERRVTGYVQVTVQGNGVFHSTMIPARGYQTAQQVMQQVNYARSLAA